jgi:hypothetical protein
LKLKWINLAPGAVADERGYWRSVEGRFEISPNYRSTVYPDTYSVRDRLRGVQGGHGRLTFDTVRECKTWATNRILDELETA